MPILGPWHEHIPLADCTYAEPEDFDRSISRCRIDLGSAVRAKGLNTFVAARSRLYIGLGNTGEEPETALNGGNDNPEGRAGKRLAIGAVANLDRFRIDFRFKG